MSVQYNFLHQIQNIFPVFYKKKHLELTKQNKVFLMILIFKTKL